MGKPSRGKRSAKSHNTNGDVVVLVQTKKVLEVTSKRKSVDWAKELDLENVQDVEFF
jgi:hypothetical protein